MKKKVILSLLFLVGMLTLSACGGPESGEGDGITGYNYRNTTDDSLWMFHTDGSVTLNVANMNNGAYFQFVRATGE